MLLNRVAAGGIECAAEIQTGRVNHHDGDADECGSHICPLLARKPLITGERGNPWQLPGWLDEEN
ncbi:MAG: hypothetical protein OXI77_10720 [Chloroflexota bacterium]|nr:hypothetical protein [Chloroflexota bacterium]MDE2908474.1 hypothetical protein [Chloroflexota bacterium]